MKRYCLALDLKNDPASIAAYEYLHKSVWPEVIESIKTSGIEDLEIYRFANRLFMIMETSDTFSFDQKALADAENKNVRAWEALMWNYQKALPGVPSGEKWAIMKKIFTL